METIAAWMVRNIKTQGANSSLGWTSPDGSGVNLVYNGDAVLNSMPTKILWDFVNLNGTLSG